MGRRHLLVAAGVTVLVAVVAAVVWARVADDGDTAGPTTTATTAPTTTAPVTTAPTTTDSAGAPVELTLTPAVDATTATLRACLRRDDVVVLDPVDGATRLGRTEEPTLVDGTTIDARDVEWVIDKGDDPPSNPAPAGWTAGTSGFRYPIDVRRFDGQPDRDLCLVGGTVTSPYPDRAGDQRDELGWELLWHKTTGIGFATEGATVVGATLESNGDGINLQGAAAEGWSMVGVRMREIHDDCVEADEHTSGRIVDTFLDGCYSAIASRSPTTEGDPRAVIEISGSLIRLQAMLAAFKPDRNGRPSHAHLFKWDADAPAVVLRNTVVRADDLPHQGQAFALPDDLECEDATFVWGGTEPLPPQGEAFERCFDDDGVAPLGERITSDVDVWFDAVAAWEAARPDLDAFG